MTQDEIDRFLMNGRSAVTILAGGGEQMAKFAESFEARGGEPVYGSDALEIVYLSNDFEAWLTPERKNTISKYRNDM